MKKEGHRIMIAAYGDLKKARTDFGELNTRSEKGLEMRSAALVIKNDDGHPEILEASNRHGGSGIAIGAGMGLLLGLFVAPPLAFSVLVGAAAGGLVTAFAEHELRIGLRHEVAAALENGTGVIVAWVYPGGYKPFLSVVEGAGAIKELPVDQQTIKSLDDAVAAASAEAHHESGAPINADTPGIGS